MMSLPAALTDRVEEAYRALFRHPERELVPWYRYAIYTALDLGDSAGANQGRAWLDILAVRHALFCWQPEVYGRWPAEWLWPEQLLRLAEQLLANAADEANAGAQINRAHAIADIVGADPTARHYPCWCVYEAALRALDSAWSAAQPPMVNAPPSLLSCTHDASRYAAIAVAGGSWRPLRDGTGLWDWQTEEAQLRRAVFWEWWLCEAIPTAWRKGQ